jgi:hypothetical protein
MADLHKLKSSTREPDLPCFAKQTHRMAYPKIADECQDPAPHMDDLRFQIIHGLFLLLAMD